MLYVFYLDLTFKRYVNIFLCFYFILQGQYAIIEFAEKQTVEKTLKSEFHFLDGKRLFVKPREVKAHSIKRKEENKVKQATEESISAGVDHGLLLEVLTTETSVSKAIIHP